MIDTIIFDFGDIFINLDKDAPLNLFKKMGLKEWTEELNQLNLSFEKGNISEENFLIGIQKNIPAASIEQILTAWNSILLDFPKYRLDFLKQLSKKYRLFLLSNTDSIHISTFEKNIGEAFYSDFYKCFEKVYFSFEMHMRKPDVKIYEYVLNKHQLVASNTLFVDDKKENTDSASTIGINVWNLQVGQEDVVELLDKSEFGLSI